MAKYSKKISKQQQENLFIDFARAVASLKNAEEVARFLRDLLSEPEVTMLSRRLYIARLLIDGLTYDKINELTGAGFDTIARVQIWLQTYGEGYRMVLARVPHEKDVHPKSSSWEQLKRKYPQHFWPEALLEELLRSAGSKQRQRLASVVADLREKTKLSKQLDSLLRAHKF